MRNCDNCAYGSYGLDCTSGIEGVCDVHKFIDGYENEEILGYDCDGNEISEFRILRFPFSADIENWDKEPNIDPRFYCLVRSSTGEVFALSVYDDLHRDYISRFERIDASTEIPMVIKPVSEMMYYEVAFCGITRNEWYYEMNREGLREKLDCILREKKGLVKKIAKNNKNFGES